jgi:AAA+ ATPase superfamily predicted ATPase
MHFFCCFALTASRIGRFSKEFKQNIEALVNYYVQEKWVKIPQFPSIIIAIGTFFNKLFKVMDRGFVFAVVRDNLRFLPSTSDHFIFKKLISNVSNCEIHKQI